MSMGGNTVERRIHKRLYAATKQVAGKCRELRTLQGRISSGHMAGSYIRDYLQPECDKLQREIDEEAAWAGFGACEVVEQYERATGDAERGQELRERINDYTENRIREPGALDYLDIYF